MRGSCAHDFVLKHCDFAIIGARDADIKTAVTPCLFYNAASQPKAQS